MESHLEKQCIQQNDKSSVWIEKNTQGESETSINFKKSGQKPESILKTKEMLSILEDQSPDNVILPDYISETNNEISFLYKQELLFHPDNGNRTKKPNLDQIVLFAGNIALALHEIHSVNLIHGKLSPNVMIRNHESHSFKLLYFGDLYFSNLLEDLPYIAPELLSNSTSDSRADLYALGVMLYKMTTGVFPFLKDETIKMFHQHLALNPEPPSSVENTIPEPLSQIITKLLKKNPETRYQTAYGVAEDLICLNNIMDNPQTKGSFRIAQFDTTPKLKFSDKLYGRDPEIQSLRDEINQLQNGKFKIIKISGKAGVGKTSLINEIIPDIQNGGKIFISGKCSQIDQQIPYQVISELFQDFVHQFLKKPDDEISDFRNNINPEFIKSAKVLTKIIPNLELITGPLPGVNSPGPIESKNRLLASFKEFIKIISTKDTPIVLFIDDLQWTDNSSIELLQSLLGYISTGNYITIIFAYRKIELLKNKNIISFFESIRDKIDLELNLHPLEKNAIANLLSDTLNCSTDDSYLLSELIVPKTKGNPFYTKVFLENLYNEKILTFNQSSQIWQWNKNQIQTQSGMENVVDLLVSGLNKLNKKHIIILKCAACLSEEFDPATLSLILDMSASYISKILSEIMKYGYITQLTIDKPQYKFSHDRIQQAAYSLISKTDLPSIHLNIAQNLNHIVKHNDNNLLRIVNYYNIGASILSSRSEVMEIIRLNIKAGQIARDQSAWIAYFKYSSSGISLAKKINHQGDYSALLKLYKQGVESARLIGEYLQMESWIEDSESFMDITTHKVILKIERLSAYMAQSRMVEVYEEAIRLIKLLEVQLPKKNKNYNFNYFRKSEKYFSSLKKMKDPLVILCSEIQMLSFSAIYLVMPNKLPTLTNQMIKLSISYGQSTYHSFVIVMYGVIHTSKPNTIKYAAKYGRLGMKLSKENSNISLQSKVNFIFGGFIQHWFEPIGNSLETLTDGWQIGINCGDFEYAVLSRNLLLFLNFASGKNLQLMKDEQNEQLEFINKLGYKRSISAVIRTYSIINNLSNNTESKFSFSNNNINENDILEKSKTANDHSAIASFYTYKLMIHYYYGDYKTALEYSHRADMYKDGLLGQFTYIFLIWFTTLCHLKLLNKSNLLLRLKIIKKNQKLLSGFSKYAHFNHSHRVQLIEAELSRYHQNDINAIKNYDLSIKNAAENGFIQDEALASECAGEFYFERKKELYANAYISHAYDCYQKWGAIRKLQDLKEKYPFLPDIIDNRNSTENIAETVSRIVDVSSVISASQAISQEIVLEDLIKTILTTVIQNSGAQKGLLFFVNDNPEHISLEASAHLNNQNYRIELDNISTAKKDSIYPKNIIDSIVKNKKTLIVHDAVANAEYSNIPYIKNNKIKSILCLPLLRMGKLTGCIYLENNLASGIFSAERLEVLKLLAGQIAISLENSRLYESLQLSHSVLEKNKEQNQEQFQQLIQAEKLASLGILAASITHEVSNPNYAIQLNSEFLSNAQNDLLALLDEYSSELQDVQINGLSFINFKEKFPQVVNTILNCSRQIDGVIKELKNYAGRDPEKPETELNINSIIESTVMMCSAYIEKATDNFSLKLEENIPTIPGHNQKLQQVFMNLIINACQALHEKSSTLCIESSYNKKDRMVQVKIVDQGTGITSDHFEQIGKPFFSTKGSMGMGLSISTEIIKLHKGTMEFIPMEEKGTSVIITLPIMEKEILKL